ncbi:MAG: DUF5615 family PIN-like protein [Rhodospirillaceae bacterium]|nr:DUF5615 family PIN-like protein [Rhodospirillaceae bacterium]
MLFLIDAQLPPGLARWLSENGYPSRHIDALGLRAASDDVIEAKARELGAVIWSKDADSAERARRTQGLQVVWLRFGNTANASLRTKLTPYLRTIEAALKEGDILVEVR